MACGRERRCSCVLVRDFDDSVHQHKVISRWRVSE